MAKEHLSNDEFLSRLGELFASRKGKDHGSVMLSQKRLTHGQQTPTAAAPPPPPPAAQEDGTTTTTTKTWPVLVRATNGKSGEARARGERVKLSTVVAPDALDAFYARCADVCKAGMPLLKPRDRSKRKTKARRRKGGAAA